MDFWRRTVAAQLHLFGCLAALVGLLVLLHSAHLKSHGPDLWACLIFGFTSIFVFAVSTTYHFMHDGFGISAQLEKHLEDLDHVAIYLFIAGTYTPFILNAISNPLSYIMISLIWTIALAGIIYTLLRPRLPQWARHRFVNTGLFVIMGWVFLARIGEAIGHMNSREVFFLFAGGVTYSIGATIYATKKPNLFHGIFGFHELWHLMVVLGFAFHYAMILTFYA